jgi:endonuclease III
MHDALRTHLLDLASRLTPADLVPSGDRTLPRRLLRNPFAFALVCCLDRGMKSSAAWSIVRELERTLGGLDPVELAAMPLPKLARVYAALPRRPRFRHDAPRTTHELAALVTTRFGGHARRIWAGRTAAEVHATFRSIHGVGAGLASMAVLSLERGFGVRFADLDRPGMDIKADVHTIRVLFRLGVARSRTPTAAIEAARRISPEFPGAIDGALWVIGSRWCEAGEPRCGGRAVASVCATGRKSPTARSSQIGNRR